MRIGSRNRRRTSINKQNGQKRHLRKSSVLNESFALNETEDVEKCPFLQLHLKNTQIYSVLMQVSISSKTISPCDKPQRHDFKGTKPSPRDNHCVQKHSPQAKTRSQKPHPRDIKLKKFHKYIYKL